MPPSLHQTSFRADSQTYPSRRTNKTFSDTEPRLPTTNTSQGIGLLGQGTSLLLEKGVSLLRYARRGTPSRHANMS